MRPAVLVLGVFGMVVALFLFVTGYYMATLPVAVIAILIVLVVIFLAMRRWPKAQ